MQPQKILFATSEAWPLVKTGGLGDVSGSLPLALRALRHDIRVVLPAYREAIIRAGKVTLIGVLNIGPQFSVRILEGKLPNTNVIVWLIDSPSHFDRRGGPYLGLDGADWPDNAERFTVFCRAIELIARNNAGLDWQPDVVHCNDWQTGLVPALLATGAAPRPATVFTIHNMAYQGIFPATTFNNLVTQFQLPPALWDINGVEFFDQLSFIKGGIAYADMLTTVSATYAQEIGTAEFGYGLAGLLSHRADRLTGILNGVDYSIWDPSHDPLITQVYDEKAFDAKLVNKTALQKQYGLPVDAAVPIIGSIGRMVEQKGVDLILAMLDELLTHDVQVVILGSGEARYEKWFAEFAARYPNKIATRHKFSEETAHLIEAGADMFLMPSRFEPCGLNQLYSLRYGTCPIVRRTGGLADTVVDATEENLSAGTATGFVFDEPSAQAVFAATLRALEMYRNRSPQWRQLAITGMKQDFSWRRSAQEYVNVYRRAVSLVIQDENS